MSSPRWTLETLIKEVERMLTLLRKLRIAVTPRSWLLKATLANGAVVYGKNRPGFGGRGIYLFRDELEPEFLHLEKFLPTSGVFVDIGANTGVHTLKAAKHLDEQSVVVAIEPFPDVLATLYHSVRANGFNNVRLRNFCVGEFTRSTTLWMNYGKPNSFSLLRRDKTCTGFSVLEVTLDELFHWENLQRLDYLKIDAEGAEHRILCGARQTIRKFRPIIQLEAIIDDCSVDLPDYLVYRAPGSINKLYMPKEHCKADLPRQLGWQLLSSPQVEALPGSVQGTGA